MVSLETGGSISSAREKLYIIENNSYTFSMDFMMNIRLLFFRTISMLNVCGDGFVRISVKPSHLILYRNLFCVYEYP